MHYISNAQKRPIMFNFFKKKQEPAQLCFNTDIHCHVIPGIDDGSPDVETSIELIERMKSWGITRIVATPHVTQASFENTPEIMSQALNSLKEGLQAKNIEIEITHSAEYRIDEQFLAHLSEGIIVPMPSNYILVENSFIQEPWNLDQLLFDLKVKGYKPILAHPERYLYYHQKRDRYKAIHSTGTKFQVNLLSLAGHYSKDERRVALELIDNGLVDFIGTDLHNHRHADAIESFIHTREYRKIKDRIPLLNDSI